MSDNKELEPGDVVRLKSGGNLMTVEGISGDPHDATNLPTVHCVWFTPVTALDLGRREQPLIVYSGEPATGRFTPEALEKV